jgi:streptogramin lyase
MRRLLSFFLFLLATVTAVAISAQPAAAAPNGITTFTNPGGIGSPTSIAAGPDGNLWFVSQIGDKIGRITPAGVITLYTNANVDGPTDITLGPDGNLWFTAATSNRIGKIVPGTGTITTYPTPVSGGRPHSIVAGPDGHLWFTLDANAAMVDDYVIESTTGGSMTPYQNANILQPHDIVSDGVDLWFTSYSNDKVVKVTTAGAITAYGNAQINGPLGIALGPDAALWVAGSVNDKLVRMTTAGTVTNAFTHPQLTDPQDVTAGPDGRLWVTSFGFPDDIVRMSTTGTQVGVFTAANVFSPQEITTGPDGNIWFTNSSSGRIGRLTIPRCGGAVATVLRGVNGFGVLRRDPSRPSGRSWSRYRSR